MTRSKKDMFFDAPANLPVLGIDHGDESHPFYLEEQVARATTAQVDDAWLDNIQDGIHTPVTMYRLDKDKNARPVRPMFVLVGTRRVMGARGAELDAVPYVMFNGTDKEAFAIFMSENEGREDDSMATQARKVERFMQTFDGTKVEAARHMKCSDMQISHMLAYLKAEEPVRRAAEQGSIPGSAVVQLSRLPAEEQIEQLPEMIRQFAAGTTTVKDVQRQIVNRERVKNGKEALSPLPGRRVWAKVIAQVAAKELKVRPDVLRIARVFAGDKPLTSVPGLAQALRAVGFEVER